MRRKRSDDGELFAMTTNVGDAVVRQQSRRDAYTLGRRGRAGRVGPRVFGKGGIDGQEIGPKEFGPSHPSPDEHAEQPPANTLDFREFGHDGSVCRGRGQHGGAARRGNAADEHYISKHAAFLAGTLLDPNLNAEEEEFRRIGVADFYLRGGTLPVGSVLGLLAEHLNTLWGGPNPVSAALYHRGRVLFREQWDKRLREHEAEVWRIRNGVE